MRFKDKIRIADAGRSACAVLYKNHDTSEWMDKNMEELLGPGKNWYKGNLHMHTTHSDGSVSPQEALKIYKKAGYDFVAMTDHWMQSQCGMWNGMLILSGCEWDAGDMVHTPVYHIVGVGMERKVKLTRSVSLTPQDIINGIDGAGGLAILAHPAWSLTDPREAMKLTGLAGAEVYNTMSGLPWNGSRADASLYFDLWASWGKMVRCIASDDSHGYSGEQTKSYIMVHADDCTASGLHRSLCDGHFYASQGPRFESVSTDGKTVKVDCSSVKYIVFYSNTVWCKDRIADGSEGHASYTVKDTDKFVRIEIIDGQGRKAWYSPFAVNNECKNDNECKSDKD